MANSFYRVRAVEGRQLLDPASIGKAQQRRVGHERYVDGEVTRAGVTSPRVRYRHTNEVELVTETSDHYFRRAIVAGDLDYVETVTSLAVGNERAWREPDLVRVTAQNKAKREAEKAAALKVAQGADESRALELEAAELGLTVAEFTAANG